MKPSTTPKKSGKLQAGTPETKLEPIKQFVSKAELPATIAALDNCLNIVLCSADGLSPEDLQSVALLHSFTRVLREI